MLRSGQCAISPNGHGPAPATVRDRLALPILKRCRGPAAADGHGPSRIPSGASMFRRGKNRCAMRIWERTCGGQGGVPARCWTVPAVANGSGPRTLVRPAQPDPGGSCGISDRVCLWGCQGAGSDTTQLLAPLLARWRVSGCLGESIAPACQRTRRIDKHFLRALGTGPRAVVVLAPTNTPPILHGWREVSSTGSRSCP